MKAVAALEEESYWAQAEAAAKALRADSHAWSDEQAERASWDATLADGLSDDT